MNILITGGAGFIGANLCHYLIESTDNKIHVVDSLTYAGNKISLKNLFSSDRFEFSNIDINDSHKLEEIFNLFKPNAVMHLLLNPMLIDRYCQVMSSLKQILLGL